MHRSTTLHLFVQPHTDTLLPGDCYLATSAQHLLEVGLSLEWIVRDLVEQVSLSEEDAALWILRVGSAPQLVAAVRPAPGNSASVQWL